MEKFEGARVPSIENKLTLKTVEFGGKEVVVTDSREVALKIDIRHDDLLKKIRTYKEIIDSNREDSEKLPSHQFFIEDTYVNSQNKVQPCYQLTKQGCEMVANKMTGKKGILFTATYVKAFNDIQEIIKNGQANFESQEDILIYQLQEQKKIRKQLNEVNHHVLKAKNEIKQLEKDFIDYKENDTLSVAECEELSDLVKKIGVARLGGKDTKAYKNKTLRISLYKNMWGEVKNQFGVHKYKQIKRKYFIKAKERIVNYEPTVYLKEKIRECNNQIDFLENYQRNIMQKSYQNYFEV